MKLLDEEQAAAPGAGVLSVSLMESVKDMHSDEDPMREKDEFWALISEELANDGLPIWRMWR